MSVKSWQALSLSALAPYLSWDCPLHDSDQLAVIARLVAEYVHMNWTVDVKLVETSSKPFTMAVFASAKAQHVYLLLQADLGYSHLVSIPRKRVAQSGSKDARPIEDSRKVAISAKSNCIAVVGEKKANRCVVLAVENRLTVFWLKAARRESLKSIAGMPVVDMWSATKSEDTIYTLRSSFLSEDSSAAGGSNMCLLSRGSLRGDAPVASAFQFKQLMCFEHPTVKRHCTLFFEDENVLFFATETVDELRAAKRKKKKESAKNSKSPSKKRRKAKPKTEENLALYVCLPPSFLKPKKKKKKKAVGPLKSLGGESEEKKDSAIAIVLTPSASEASEFALDTAATVTASSKKAKKKKRGTGDRLSAKKRPPRIRSHSAQLMVSKPKKARRALTPRPSGHSRVPSFSRKSASVRAPLFSVTRVLIPDALRYVFRAAKCHYAFWHESSESIVLLIKKSNASMVGDPKMKGFVDALQRSYDSRGVDQSERVFGRLLLKLRLTLIRGSQPSICSVSIGSVRIEEAKTRIVAYNSKKAAVWIDTKHWKKQVTPGVHRYGYYRMRWYPPNVTHHCDCRLRVMRLNDMVYKWRHVYSL